MINYFTWTYITNEFEQYIVAIKNLYLFCYIITFFKEGIKKQDSNKDLSLVYT